MRTSRDRTTNAAMLVVTIEIMEEIRGLAVLVDRSIIPIQIADLLQFLLLKICQFLMPKPPPPKSGGEFHSGDQNTKEGIGRDVAVNGNYFWTNLLPSFISAENAVVKISGKKVAEKTWEFVAGIERGNTTQNSRRMMETNGGGGGGGGHVQKHM